GFFHGSILPSVHVCASIHLNVNACDYVKTLARGDDSDGPAPDRRGRQAAHQHDAGASVARGTTRAGAPGAAAADAEAGREFSLRAWRRRDTTAPRGDAGGDRAADRGGGRQVPPPG